MGTRHLICIFADGEYHLAQYGQWDGYPSGQGATIVDFLLNRYDPEAFKENVLSTEEVTEEEFEQLYVAAGAAPGATTVSRDVAKAFSAANPALSRDTGAKVRVIDGLVTEGYAPLSHDTALSMAAQHFGPDRNVIEYKVTTTEMRLRIADEPIELGKPIKMIEVWNSETGHRSLSFWGRLWRLVCTNGMAVTEKDYGRARYTHVGDMWERVASDLPSRLAGMQRAMDEGRERYEQAEQTRIDWAPEVKAAERVGGPVEEFVHQVNKARKTRIPDRVLAKVCESGLHDATSHEYGTLAGAVDGITRVAQDEDPGMQKLLEDIAFDVLQRGLRKREHDLIPVRPLTA